MMLENNTSQESSFLILYVYPHKALDLHDSTMILAIARLSQKHKSYW